MSTPGDRIRAAGERISQVGLDMPVWFSDLGIAAWLTLGIAAVISLAGWLFVYSASISIPLVLAIVIGMIAYPLCEKMTARGVNKSAAAGLVLILLGAIMVFVVWIVVAGVISQWPNISAQIEAGFAELANQLEAAGWDTAAIKSALEEVRGAASDPGTATTAAKGALSSVASGLSGAIDFLFGLFISATLLFYVLSDFPNMADWVSRHMGRLPRDVSNGIIEDAVGAMRGYFRGTTITGLVVATVIGVAMLLMKVPLAGTVAIVTFLTCYIPFFGAIISGAFAFVVALGANGLPTAIALLVIVLVAQNVLQTVISARVMGDSLDLHPLVVLVVTMLGGIFGGLLGAALGAPLAALFINAGKRLNAALSPGGVGSEAAVLAEGSD